MVRSGLKIRPKYEAYFIRQPIEGIILEKKFVLQKMFTTIHLRKKNLSQISGIPDPDYMFSGFFEIFESLSDMVLA